MKLKLQSVLTAHFWTMLASIMLLTLMSACGGGNGSAGTPLGGSGGGTSTGGGTGTGTGTGTTKAAAITVTLTNAGTPSNTIPLTGNLTVTANVLTASGAPAPTGTLVTFAVLGTDGTLPVTTALTDTLGNASVSLLAGTAIGAGTVTASATVGSAQVTGSTTFQSNSTGTTSTSGSSMTLALTDSSNAQVNTIPSGSALNVTATLVNSAGVAVPNVVVNFVVSNATGSLPVNTALTNSSGVATISLQSGTIAGAGTVTATATVAGAAITQQVSYKTAGAGSTATPSITLALSSSAGCTANIVSASCPLTASATILDASGNPVPNILVTFGDSLSLTGLSPLSGTVLTNASGVATTSITTNGLISSSQNGSAGTISASVTVAGVTVSNSSPFSLGNTAITLALVNPAPTGTSTTSGAVTVNAYGTTTITVQVDSNGSIYTAQPVTVSFSSGCGTSGNAIFPATATAVSGQATITYKDNGCAATDTLTATVAGATTPVTVAVKDTAPTAVAINFVSAVPSDESIVLPGTGGTGRTSTALLTFEVVDTNGNPISGDVVNFTLVPTGVATLNTQNATTSSTSGSLGQVTATVTAAAVGTFAVQATLNGSAISAISNSVVVSTGVPVQASFTLAASTFNIEGWDYAGVQSTLTAYIADVNGQPVVNGTPVSASTDEGSVGNASGVSAGCTTTGGNCSVLFTSQLPHCDNPLPSGACGSGSSNVGIATVNFTSNNDTTTPLARSIQIYLSGSDPYFYSDISGTWTLMPNGGTITATNCLSSNISLALADLNGNPMPFNTGITVTTSTTGLTLGTIFPAAVNNIGVGEGAGFAMASVPNGVVNAQNITIPFTLATPLAPCKSVLNTTTSSFTFQIKTTTPKGQSDQNTYTYVYPTN